MAKPFKVNTSAIGKFQNGKLYTLQEIADIAGTTHSTMYLATENGDLKTKKIRRTGKGSPFCSSALGEDVREWLLRKSGEQDVGAKTPERKIYEFMLSYQKRNGKPPIISDIATAVGMSPAYVKKKRWSFCLTVDMSKRLSTAHCLRPFPMTNATAQTRYSAKQTGRVADVAWPWCGLSMSRQSRWRHWLNGRRFQIGAHGMKR